MFGTNKHSKGTTFFYSGRTGKEDPTIYFSGTFTIHRKMVTSEVFTDITEMKKKELDTEVCLTSLNKL